MSLRNRTWRFLAKVNLFLRQPRSILNRLLDVFPFQIRVALQNFLERCPMSDLTHNYGDRYTHSAYARSPAHDLGIKGNSVEHKQDPPSLGSYREASPSFRIQRLQYDSQALAIRVNVFIRGANMAGLAYLEKRSTREEWQIDPFHEICASGSRMTDLSRNV
jgi:hypothetical protein